MFIYYLDTLLRPSAATASGVPPWSTLHTKCSQRSCSRNHFSLGWRGTACSTFSPALCHVPGSLGSTQIPVQTGRGAIRQSSFIPLDFFIQLTDFSSEIKSFNVLSRAVSWHPELHVTRSSARGWAVAGFQELPWIFRGPLPPSPNPWSFRIQSFYTTRVRLALLQSSRSVLCSPLHLLQSCQHWLSVCVHAFGTALHHAKRKGSQPDCTTNSSLLPQRAPGSAYVRSAPSESQAK